MADKETARVEAFSDGVFAIAVTLLILEIRLPHLPAESSSNDLRDALLKLWPSYLAFVLSFVTILIMWINHHELFRMVDRLSRSALFANGFLLLMVTFVNFPTAVLADHLEEAGACVSASFYCGTFIAISISYLILFRTMLPEMRAKAMAACDQGSAPSAARAHDAAVARVCKAYAMGLVVYSAATVAASFAPYVGLAMCMALWVLWILLDYRARK